MLPNGRDYAGLVRGTHQKHAGVEKMSARVVVNTAHHIVLPCLIEQSPTCKRIDQSVVARPAHGGILNLREARRRCSKTPLLRYSNPYRYARMWLSSRSDRYSSLVCS